MPCSRNALAPARTKLNPPVESIASATVLSASPSKRQFLILTIVSSSLLASNFHSTRLGLSGPFHSIRIRLFSSIAFTSTVVETPYISQSHRIFCPAARGPLERVNQKRVVTSGSTNALNTSAADLRMSICAFATGGWIVMAMYLLRIGSDHARCVRILAEAE